MPDLVPNEPYTLSIKLDNLGHVFLLGHRIRLVMTSSLFPCYHANPNTGAICGDEEAGHYRVATQTVFARGDTLSGLMVCPGGDWMSKRVALPVRIERLGEDRGDEVAALFGRAFHDDPLFVHACPDPCHRALWLPWLFRRSTWKGFLVGQTLGTAGAPDGVAALVGPAGGEFTAEDLTRFGYDLGREAVGSEIWDRATAACNVAFELADAALHRAVPESHWYLDAIAVEPTRQGRGIGSALLRAASTLADTDGISIVLLTFQPQNLSLYERHGCAVVCQGSDELPWWGMRRSPVTPPRAVNSR